MHSILRLILLALLLCPPGLRAAGPILIFSTGSLSGAAGSTQSFQFTVPEGLRSLTPRGKFFSATGRGFIEAVAIYDRIPTEEDLDAGYPRSVLYPTPGTWYMLVRGITRFSGLGFEAIGLPDPQPYARYAGAFSALIGDDTFISILLTRTGAFTGRLTLPGGTFPFKGTINANGESASNAPVPYSFRLTSSSGGNDPATAVMAGQVTGLPFSAWHSAYGPTASAPEAGRYTMLLSPTGSGSNPPAGTGFGSAIITKTGAVRIAGRLANGSLLSTGALLQGSASGKREFILFPTNLDQGQSRLASTVTMDALAQSDFSGQARWIKPAAKTGAYYRGGLATSVTVAGARYGSRARGLMAVDFPARADNVRLTLRGGSLPSDLTTLATLSSLNVVSISGANPATVKVTINAAAGSFSGSFIHPRSQKATPFAGALFQKAGAPKAAGFFLGPIEAGAGFAGDISLAPN